MLPKAWVEKIFSKFEARYGSMFHDRWKGCDLNNVAETWAEELGNFADKPECIGHALIVLASAKYPPSLPEFLEACRQAPRKEVPALRYVPTPADEERARTAAAEAARIVKKRSDEGIDTHWATHPKSVMHMEFISAAAVRDKRFQRCIDEMVEKEICTENGVLLQTFTDGQWRPVVRRAT